MSRDFYENIIKKDRLRPSSQPDRDTNHEMVSDHARVVTSNAFRRLQAKAQVFSLEENASVRTRLTHSLEVSAFGRQLAQRIFSKLHNKKKIDKKHEFAFVSLVETSCLLHDIGNPPFGHFGEYSIRNWFKRNWKEISNFWISKNKNISNILCKKYSSDFFEFDGNAQGFRIITKLQWHNDHYGLNLTCSLLSAYLKYISCNSNPKIDFQKKIGFFKTEEKIFKDISKVLELKNSKRNPLAYVMEAADDLAYCLSDIEDGIEKNIITPQNFIDYIIENTKDKKALNIINNIIKYSKNKIINPEYDKKIINHKNKEKIKFFEFRINLTRKLQDMLCDCYINNHDDILNGTARPLKKLNKSVEVILNTITDFAKNNLFCSKYAADIELAGHSAISGILDKFKDVLTLSSKEFNDILNNKSGKGAFEHEKRLIWMLPKKQLNVYEYEKTIFPNIEPILRAHLIIDYISGMTDNHAIQVYQILSGISIGVRP